MLQPESIARDFTEVAPVILAAQQLSRDGIDGDALAVGPMTATELYRIAHRPQRSDRAGAESGLQVENIG